jgi:hypothetical protein
MKRNIFLTFIFLVLSLYCKGQTVAFSPIIQSSDDTSIKAIAQLWENYITSIREEQSDSIQRSFWYNESEDLIRNKHPHLLYLWGWSEVLTFNIRKYSDTVYEIHSLQKQKRLEPESHDTPNILYVYKLCAIETGGGFKLLNYFDVYKSSLQNYTSESVEFYYPCGFNFDIEKADDVEKFIRQFRKDYNLESTKNKIICVIGNTLNESNYFLGFDYTIFTSKKKYAGGFIFPRTIITCRQDHIHEFVHALIQPAFPDILSLLNEGIATYYGGVGELDYASYRNIFRNYVIENSIDFSEQSSFVDVWIDEAATGRNLGGALIIEYTLKNYGITKVIELFSCKDYQEIYSKLGIQPEDIANFLLN